MTLTTLQKTQLNNSNRAMQKASIGTLLGALEAGTAGPFQKITQTVLYSQFTDGGGTSGTFVITAGTIPVGAKFLYSTISALTGFTGDTTAVITLGDGSDVDRYNTGTPSVFTTASGGIDVGVPSGTTYHSAAKSITLTVTSGSDFGLVTAGALTVNFYYLA